jgi:putative two-component system response regulator
LKALLAFREKESLTDKILPKEAFVNMMTKILIVDDEEPIRRVLGRLLENNDYRCTLAANPAEARECLKNENFELILCDLVMPGESGLDFIKYSLATHPDTAAMVVTATDDPEVAKTATEIGCYGYIIKPFEHNEVLINVANSMRRRQLVIDKRIYSEELERIVDERTAELKERETKLEHSLNNFRKAMKGIVNAMALTIESRDPYTAGHQQRTAGLACAIAKETGLSKEVIDGIQMAGIIHDIGKIAIPAEILSKPTRLTDIEFSLMQTHTQVGHDILKGIEFPWPVAQIVLQHHERMDGSGYPSGLSGEEILMEARILGVADTVEAMASHRPYRPALGMDKALAEISQNRGILYDPEVVDACLKLFKERGFKLK